MPMDQLQPVGALPAKQERSQETARRIVDAVEALLERKSFDQLTMVEIAEEAKLTPGAIYRRFKNKEALLPHIFDRYRLILGAWIGRLSAAAVLERTGSLDEAIEMVVRETFKTFKQNDHIFRTVHIFGRLHPEQRMASVGGSENREFAPLDGILAHYRDEIGGVKPAQVKMMGHVLISSVAEKALYPENLPAAALGGSDRQFIKDLALMLVSWLKRRAD